VAPGRTFAGGHSYGGRQASLALADDPGLAGALLLLSYPLHPPRRRAARRTAHLPALRAPTLFVHGTRDPFGTVAELETARALIPARTALMTLQSGHDLREARGHSGWPALASRIVAAFLELAA
jgi:predicted alpha/beta-hydrolase family hydrolase